MRNFFKARIVPLFGIIVLVTVIGFSMAACDDGSDDGSDDDKGIPDCPFVGTWRSPQDGGYYVLVFVDFPRTFTITSPTGNVESGDYTWSFLSPNAARMEIKKGGSGTFNVTISGNTLSFGSRTYTKS